MHILCGSSPRMRPAAASLSYGKANARETVYRVNIGLRGKPRVASGITLATHQRCDEKF